MQTLSSIIPYGIGRRVKNAVHLAVRPVAFPSALEKAEVENSNSNGGSGCRGLTAAVRGGEGELEYGYGKLSCWVFEDPHGGKVFSTRMFWVRSGV